MSVSGNREHTAEELAWLHDMAEMREEPLHPDLEDWVEDGQWGRMLRHPLVYNIPLFLPGEANHTYEVKRRALAEAINEEDWSMVVWTHERPHRLNALITYVTGRYEDEEGEPIPLDALPQEQATIDLVADVWVDSENIAQHIEDWRALFGKAETFWLGEESERAEFDALPDPVTAYRAGIDDGDWSWSTKREIAEFFAARFRDDDPLPVIERAIPKSQCFGYLTRRNEDELLVRLEES